MKVIPKAGIPSGMKVASELHWHKIDAWGGTLSWGPLKPADPGKKLVFRHTPKQKPGMAKINAITYLTPKGFNEKVKIAYAEIPLSVKSAPPAGAPGSRPTALTPAWGAPPLPMRITPPVPRGAVPLRAHLSW